MAETSHWSQVSTKGLDIHMGKCKIFYAEFFGKPLDFQGLT